MNPIVELCEHGEAKPHEHWRPSARAWSDWVKCPGGRMLKQAIIIERDTDGKWPEWTVPTMRSVGWTEWNDGFYERMLDALASAQRSQLHTSQSREV